MKDALGMPIIVGSTYGYSRNSNGLTTVSVGDIVRENSMTVSMKVAYSGQAMYSKDIETIPNPKKLISVKANMLFPVE